MFTLAVLSALLTGFLLGVISMLDCRVCSKHDTRLRLRKAHSQLDKLLTKS